MKELDHFYLSKEEPHQGCLLALRKLILDQDELITETRKYKMPCFYYKKRVFCYLWTDKKTNEPYLLMVEGKHLDHPLLESGDRKRMKILPIDPNSDLPLEVINVVLKQALDLYRSGTIKS